jgi:hypothetical protein
MIKRSPIRGAFDDYMNRKNQPTEPIAGCAVFNIYQVAKIVHFQIFDNLNIYQGNTCYAISRFHCAPYVNAPNSGFIETGEGIC